MTQATESQLKVLVMGLDQVCLPVVKSLFLNEQIYEVPFDLEKFMELSLNPEPFLLLIGPPPQGVNLNEVAQVARMQFQAQPIFYLTSARVNFDRKEFLKNGFTDAFLLPLETDIVTQSIREAMNKASSGAVKSYKTVKLIDLQPDQKLEFATYMYMPVNRKHVKITAEGDEIDKHQIDKLSKNAISSIHVESKDIQKFYDFAAAQLKNLKSNSGISETERKDRMSNAIRGLMAGVFNDSTADATVEKGRSIISDCQEIIKSYIVQSDANKESGTNEWYSKLLQATGAESGAYSHTGNVATFGALFSLATGLGKPEDVALAGLLHDMGLADVPAEIQSKPEKERSKEEQEIYKKHVDHTLNIIKFRKMILPEIVIKAISQHHEKWSGTGYPKGHAGNRICVEAQLLALADEFDYRTITKEGKPRTTPGKALKELFEENQRDPSNATFDLELLKKIKSVFPEEEVK